MSLTIDSLSSALAGLQATKARIDTVSRNISNASTDGYSRKLQQQTTTDQGLVSVGPVQRSINQAVVESLRLSTSNQNRLSASLNSLSQLEAVLGTPQENTGLSAAITQLQTAFQDLATSPQKDSVYGGVVAAADAVSRSFNKLWNAAEGQRTQANDQIGSLVQNVNDLLTQIDLTNKAIVATRGAGDTTDLEDHRDRLLSQLSGLMEVKTFTQPTGAIAIYSTAGTPLLDVAPNPIDASKIGSQQQPPPVGPLLVIKNGTLGGLLQIRDQAMPQLQAQLDDMARAVALEFGQTGIKLFNDGGSIDFPAAPAPNPLVPGGPLVANDPLQVSGFAKRISLNEAIRAAPTTIRDGDSATPLQPGDTTYIDKAVALLSRTDIAFTSSTGLAAHGSFAQVATDWVAQRGADRASTESALDHEKSINQIFADKLSQVSGVNIDDEMSQLVVLQQAYAANAKVVTTAKDLLDALLNSVR